MTNEEISSFAHGLVGPTLQNKESGSLFHIFFGDSNALARSERSWEHCQVPESLFKSSFQQAGITLLGRPKSKITYSADLTAA